MDSMSLPLDLGKLVEAIRDGPPSQLMVLNLGSNKIILLNRDCYVYFPLLPLFSRTTARNEVFLQTRLLTKYDSKLTKPCFATFLVLYVSHSEGCDDCLSTRNEVRSHNNRSTTKYGI